MNPKIIVIGGEEFEVPEGTTREQFAGYLAREGIAAKPAELDAAFGGTPGAAAAPAGDAGFFGPGGAGDVGARFAKGAFSEVDPRRLAELPAMLEAEKRKTPWIPDDVLLSGMFAKGLVAPLAGVPGAVRQIAGGDIGGGADALARSVPVLGPTYGNVADRYAAGDTAGAIGAGVTGLATSLLPAARAAGASKIPSVTGALARGAAPFRPVGVRMAEGILDVDKPAARAVLAEGGLRAGIPAGIRKLGRRAGEASERAAAGAPAGRLGPPTRTGFGPAVTDLYSRVRGTKDAPTALVAEEVRAAKDAATMHAPTYGDAIRQAEATRTRLPERNLPGVLGVSGTSADAERAIAADLRARVRPNLSNAGQRDLDIVDRVAGPHQTLAAARAKAAPPGAALGGAGGGTRGMVAHALATGGAATAQGLYGGLTEKAFQQMLRAAILARFAGVDQPEP